VRVNPVPPEAAGAAYNDVAARLGACDILDASVIPAGAVPVSLTEFAINPRW
jgi:hypothetical protein